MDEDEKLRKNAWFINHKPTSDNLYCVYQVTDDGGIDDKLGPFFVLGRDKAIGLHMMLCGMNVINDHRIELIAKVAQYEGSNSGEPQE